MQVPREGLEQKLQKLSSSQASIESVSAFCIFYHKDARGVVQIWEQEFYKAPPERKVSLLYLANHVLQEGRRKGTGFMDEYYKVLPKALSHLLKHGDEKGKKAATRLVGVWEERRVFGSKHIKSFREILPQGSSQAKSGGSGSSSSSMKQLGPAGAALAAAQQAAAAVTEKEQEFNKSWTPTLFTTGGLPEVTAASSQLNALTAALQTERDARQAAIAALQAEIAAQAAAAGGLGQRITSCEQQQQQLQSRMAFLSAQMASVVAGLTGMAGLLPQQATNGSGAAVAGGTPPALPDAGDSPQAPALEEEDDDMPHFEQQQQNPTGTGMADADHSSSDATGAIFAALSGLPHDARDKIGTDMQQLLAMGLLGNPAPAASTGTNLWTDGQQQELGMLVQPNIAAPGAGGFVQQNLQQQQQQPPWGDVGVAGSGLMGALDQLAFLGNLGMPAVGQQGQAEEEEEEEPYDPENPL